MDGYGTTLTGREQFDYIFFYLNFCSIVSFSEEDTLDGNGCLYLLLFYDPIFYLSASKTKNLLTKRGLIFVINHRTLNTRR